MATRTSFVLYTEYRDHIKLLTDEDKGKLLTAIFDYAAGEQPDVSGMALMAFSFIRAQMDRDAASYEEKIANRQSAGKRGGRPKKETPEEDEEPESEVEESEETEKAKKANGYLGFSEKAKKANGYLGFSEKAKKANGFLEKQNNPVYVDVYDNVDVDVYVNDNDNVLNTHNNSVCARESECEESISQIANREQAAKGSNAPWSGRVVSTPVYQAMISQCNSLFEEFWNTYPKQVDKEAALEAWGKLNIDEQLFTEIMKGLESASKSQQWAENNGRFIPYPANFLNKRLWDLRYEPTDAETQHTTFTIMQGHDWDMDDLETRMHNKALSL